MTPRNVKNPSGYVSKGKNPKEKVVNFVNFIKEFGWTGSWKEDPETKDITLIANREAERIEIYWNTPIAWPEVFYSYASHKVKCRNVSAAAKYAQGEPDPERMRRVGKRVLTGSLGASMQPPSGPVAGPDGAEVGSSDPGAPDAATGDLEALRSYVPFDKTSTAEEVKEELKHYRTPTITWVNRLTGVVNSAIVKANSRNFKVTTNKKGEVIINFTDTFGFHAVYAHSVIGVQ
jgi:hypothetical protein